MIYHILCGVTSTRPSRVTPFSAYESLVSIQSDLRGKDLQSTWAPCSMSSSMYSARHVWHGFRLTVSRSLLHTEFSVPRHLKVLKFSTSLRINPTYPCSPRPPSPLLDFSLQRRFQQCHYSSKIPPRDNKPTSTGSQNDLEPIPPKFDSLAKAIHENIYTLPNLLTASRIAACPVLGWAILSDDYLLATGLLAYAGVTDWVRPNTCCSGRRVWDC